MLTQEELLGKLEAWGEKTTAQTLRNREKLGIVSSAYRGGAGRPGRSVFYPDRVLWENFAASKMLSSAKMRLTAKEVMEARTLALKMESDPASTATLYYQKPEEERLDLHFANIWHGLVVYAWLGCPQSVLADVFFHDGNTRHVYVLIKDPENSEVKNLSILVNSSSRNFVIQGAGKVSNWKNEENRVNLDALF